MHGVGVRTMALPGEQSPLPARLYLVEEGDRTATDALVVFLPGGGFSAPLLDQTDCFARLLAASTQLPVLATSYTPACVRPFPAAAEDVHAGLRWVARHPGKLGWSGRQLIIAGVEAGGNLAAVAALMARDRGGPKLAAQILIMPMLDPDLTSGSMRTVDRDATARHAAGVCAAGYRSYLPRPVDRAHPYASPLRASRLTGLPPALLLCAQNDPLRDEARLYAGKLEQAKVRTVLVCLPHARLEEPNGRTHCIGHEGVLLEIQNFLAGLGVMTGHAGKGLDLPSAVSRKVPSCIGKKLNAGPDVDFTSSRPTRSNKEQHEQ